MELEELMKQNNLGFDKNRKVKERHYRNSHSVKYEEEPYWEKEKKIIKYKILRGNAPQHIVEVAIPVLPLDNGGIKEVYMFDDWWFDTVPLLD